MSPEQSINDDALDEIHEDSDYLTHDEGKVVTQGTAVVGADENSVLPEPTDVDAAVEQLTGYDVEIKTMEDDVAKTHSLKDVAQTVLSQESISQSDAEEIERKVGGLYDSVAMRQEYSEIPTRVNLRQTQEYVAAKLEEHQTSAVQRHREYLTKTYAYACKLLQALNDGMVQELVDELEALRQRCTLDLAKASTSQALMVYRKVGKDHPPEIVDLRKLVLWGGSGFYESFELGTLADRLPKFDDVTKFQETQSPIFKRMLNLATKSSGTMWDGLHDKYHYSDCGDEGGLKKLCYLELLALLASGVLTEVFSKSLVELNQAAEKAAEVIPTMLAEESTEEARVALLSESALATSDFYERLMALEQFRMAAYMFNYRAKVILDSFGSILHG